MRPDGGCTMTIRAVEADGRLGADHANPRPRPYARAEATLDGRALKVLLELRAGGYDGSTYSLVYDPADDSLKGSPHEAATRQPFDVRFVRLGR